MESLRETVAHLGELLASAAAAQQQAAEAATADAKSQIELAAVVASTREAQEAAEVERAAAEQRAAELEGQLSEALANLEEAKVRLVDLGSANRFSMHLRHEGRAVLLPTLRCNFWPPHRAHVGLTRTCLCFPCFFCCLVCRSRAPHGARQPRSR